MSSAAEVAGWLRTAFGDGAMDATALATYVDAVLRFGIDAQTMDDLSATGGGMSLADAGIDNAVHRSKVARAWNAARQVAAGTSVGGGGGGGGGGGEGGSDFGAGVVPFVDTDRALPPSLSPTPSQHLRSGGGGGGGGGFRRSPSSDNARRSLQQQQQPPPQQQQRSRGTQPSPPSNELALGMVEGWEGFSMEDAKEHSNAAAAAAHAMTPAEVLASLQRGNARFWMGVSQRPEANAFQRRALIMQQFPSVCILGCSDSRVPIEIVFDQGLGDIFVVRVAGNCLGDGVTASLEYAVHHLNVKCLVVMGHEGCGAVKAAGLPREQLEAEPVALREALLAMKEGIDEERLAHIHDARARDREAVVTNVVTQLRRLGKEHASVMEKICSRELLVTGAFYEISSGIVDFFGQLEPSGTVRGWEGVVSPRKKAAVGGGSGGDGAKGDARDEWSTAAE